MSDLDLRRVSAADFSVAVDWAAAEGWNPGLDDLSAFHGTDPGGFFMGYIDGRPVSSLSVVRYGADFGFLGFYIVHPDHRGSGAGIATWNHGMAYLAGCTVGLDGVVAQQDTYRKSGFVFAGRNVRHSGTVPAAAARESGTEITDVDADRLPALLAYDRGFFAAPRDRFTAAWTGPAKTARRWTKLATAEGEIVGYGTLRACRSGYKIGPLFAVDEKTVLDLFLALCAKADAGAEIALDTPEGNPAALALARRFNLQPVFETARMYRGAAPALPLARIFGVTTSELG